VGGECERLVRRMSDCGVGASWINSRIGWDLARSTWQTQNRGRRVEPPPSPNWSRRAMVRGASTAGDAKTVAEDAIRDSERWGGEIRRVGGDGGGGGPVRAEVGRVSHGRTNTGCHEAATSDRLHPWRSRPPRGPRGRQGPPFDHHVSAKAMLRARPLLAVRGAGLGKRRTSR